MSPSLWNPDPDVLCREELPLLGPLARRLQSLPVASACPTGSEDVVLPVLGPGAWDCCCWYWASCWRGSFSYCWRTRMVLCIPSTSSSSWMMKSFSSSWLLLSPHYISSVKPTLLQVVQQHPWDSCLPSSWFSWISIWHFAINFLPVWLIWVWPRSSTTITKSTVLLAKLIYSVSKSLCSRLRAMHIPSLHLLEFYMFNSWF